MRDSEAISDPERRVSITALVAETMAVQAVGTLSVLAIPALAPEVARALGVPASQAGYQVGIVYAAATLFSLFASPAVAAFGPCRTGQIAMILTALGSAAASVPQVWTIVAGSVLLGASYGLINPAASELLIRHSPPSRRNLIFSLKQTGVPLGGMAAGLLGPPVALVFGWPAVLLLVAATALVLAALSQLTRPILDGPRRKAATGKGLQLLHSLQVIAQSRKLLWLSLSSFCFAAVQLCVIAFLVALLVEDLGFSLVMAGAILAATQVCGAIGRVLWGLAADKLRDGVSVLFGLGLLMCAASLAVAVFVQAWPAYAAAVPFLILGLSAAGWNGVYLSEVARHSPAHAVSATTGAAMFFTFAGVVICPPVFSMLHGVLGSYILCYAPLAALSLLGAFMVRATGLRDTAGESV
jgi:predicted MFS family arabinose efflux permease